MTFAQGPTHERTDSIIQSPLVAPDTLDGPPEQRVETPVIMSGAGSVRTNSASRFAPDALIASLVGLVLLVMGLIAIIRGGFDGPMAEPIIKVLGFTHTTTLGLIDVAIGACLLVSGATSSRSGELFFGGVLGIAAFIGAVQTTSFHTSLALESSMAWIATIAGIVVVAAALLLPRYAKSSTSIQQSHI